MSFTKPRVSLTGSLLVLLLLFSLPIRCLCRQQFIRSRFAVRYKPSSLGITTHGEREKRSAVPPKIFSGSSCCYCGPAVYKATFISKWNKTTHPVDFPDKLAHFSAVIGGTHRAEHVIWELGSKASAAVKKFGEWGDTRSLLNKISRRQYLGIIRTSQVWKSNRPVSDRFRADRTRHYLSIMSKISPSPDWFVGIDRLDLCNASSCTWKNNVTLQLTPIDAGTDSGLKFITNNMATKPSQPIHRISPNYPNHPDASFFHRQQKNVLPMAEFKVELLHTKGKCTQGSVHCKVSRWSSWTSCSNSCGRGKKTRGRVILIEPKNNGKACPKITRSKGCRGRNCTGKADCLVKNWSRWSSCSKTCGKGRRTRKRQIVVYPREGGKNCPNLTEKEKCRRPKCPIVDCKVSLWSNWDACNKSCGRGKRQRRRDVVEPPSKGGARCPRLQEKQACNIFRCRGISRLSSISG